MRQLETISISCGQGGLNSSKSPDVIRDTDLTAVESLTYEDDTWKKDWGATKFNSVAVTGPDPEIRSMYNFRAGESNELVVGTRDRRLFVVGSGGITSTISSTSLWCYHSTFVEGYNGTKKALYHFAGVGFPLVYTGGGSTALPLGSEVGVVTADSSTDTFTRTAHGLTNNTLVFFSNSGGALPVGLDLGGPNKFSYWVVNATANTFQVSTFQDGPGINFTTNGTGVHTVHRSTMPNDWENNAGQVRWGFLHRGRMFTGGSDNFPYSLYVSALQNNNDFLGAGALLQQVYPGEADMCIGGISWRNKAYVFKFPYGIYVLDDADTDTARWGWRRISKYVGAISQASIVEADDDVYFISADGYIHALSAIQESGDVRSSAVKGLEIGPYIRNSTDFSKLSATPLGSFFGYPVPQGVYYPTKRKLIFSFSSDPNVMSAQGKPINKVLIGLDLHRSDPSAGIRDAQPFVCTRDEYESLCVYRDPTTGDPVLLAGDSNGFIYKLDQPFYSKDGAGYSASFATKEFYPYGNAGNANLRELEVMFAPGSSNNRVTISVYQDGALSTTGTLTDASPRMRLFGDCRRFYIRGENSAINESFSIVRIDVRYVQGNVR